VECLHAGRAVDEAYSLIDEQRIGGRIGIAVPAQREGDYKGSGGYTTAMDAVQANDGPFPVQKAAPAEHEPPFLAAAG